MNIWTRYLRVLDRYPMRTQMVQSGIIMGTGDVISQFAIERKDHLEVDRCLRFAAIGSIFVAPIIRMWYLKLEKIFGPSVTIKSTLGKVATDQFGFAPIFTGVIIGVIGTSQSLTNYVRQSEPQEKKYDTLRQDISNIGKKLKAEYVDIVITGWKIWPAAQLANFYLVPFLLRPLVVSVVALFWNTYLAWKTNQGIVSEKN